MSNEHRESLLRRAFMVTASSALFTVSLAAQPGSGGRIIISSDEWFLSDTGFNAQPASTNAFVANVTSWFGRGAPGRSFLAYSSNFSLTGAKLQTAVTNLGHTWTKSTSVTWDLPTLLTYDGIFLASTQVPDFQILAQYVQAGGGVYIAGGTSSNAAAVAAAWNPFLNGFGLALDASSDGLCFGGCSLSISSSHPLLAGVLSLYHDRGQDTLDLDGASPLNQVIATVSGGHERFAIYESPAPIGSCTFRNGSGINVAGFGCVTNPVLGSNWTSSIATLPSTQSTWLAVACCPAQLQISNLPGELLLDPAVLFLLPTATVGTHTLPLPSSPSLLGVSLTTQGLRIDLPGPSLVMLNAQDLVLGL
jgi:hypothetical protein